MIITTKELSDELFEEQYYKEKMYLQMERDEYERAEMKKILNEPEVILGKVRIRGKFEQYGTVERKTARIFRKHLQPNN